ncbi:MAG: hypothetical protein ACK4ND_03585 [Cytophagaceae bacterium]
MGDPKKVVDFDIHHSSSVCVPTNGTFLHEEENENFSRGQINYF